MAGYRPRNLRGGAKECLDVDPGEATNRTVVTFVGSPEAVVEAAFAGGEKGRRADRHAQTQGGASAHGRYGRAAADPDRGHHARRVRRTGPQTGRAYRRGTACPDLLLRSRGVYAPARGIRPVCREGEYGALPKSWRTRVGARFWGASVGARCHSMRTSAAREFPDRRSTSIHLHAPPPAIAFDVREKGGPHRGQWNHGQGGRDAERNTL